MLEWTICEKCGKILDNSQEICNSCNTPVGKINMDYLTQYLSNTLFLVKTLDTVGKMIYIISAKVSTL